MRAFAEDSAVVALASRTASGQLRSATITLRWVESEQVGGDWKSSSCLTARTLQR